MDVRTRCWHAGETVALLNSVAMIALFVISGCSNSQSDVSDTTGNSKPDGFGDAVTAESIPAGNALPVAAEETTDTELDSNATGKVTGPESQTSSEGSAASGTPASSTGLTLANPPSEQKPIISPGLSPQTLKKLLADIDYNLRVLMSGQSGINDPQEARKKLLNYINMKLEASRNLATHEDSSAMEKSQGARGELQAMSHLASVGNVKVAEELEKLAQKNLSSEDASLVSDSRLILIGFSLEDLKNGKAGAATDIVRQFQQMKDAKTKPDVPTLMIMGMAREDLNNAGFTEEAQSVREMILILYADSPDPAIAEMAASMAGSVTFEKIEKQRAALVSETPEIDKKVTVDEWSRSVETLIEEAPDLQTAQYLAAAALEFEGLQREDLVDATYKALSDNFGDSSSAISKEINVAQQARKARKEVIGKNFRWNLPGTDGQEMPISQFAGKIILMPFWTQAFPSSLGIVPQLKKIRDEYPDKVVIVGVNLDPEGIDVQPFINKSQLDFVSFRSESSPSREISNQIAHDFGMVSLPFVAILDETGVIRSLNFTGRNLDTQVMNLITQ